LVFGLTLAACGSSAARPDPLALTLHAQDIKFDATTLSASVGQPVTLTYINQGLIDHAFVIDNFVDEQTVSPGQTTTFNFTPARAGTFKFYCAIPGHEAAGMTGMLIVTQ
jgi:nitrite reductase (NO-forming)